MAERDRAIELYTFLKEFVQLRTRTIRDVSSYEQDGEVIWAADIPRERVMLLYEPARWLRRTRSASTIELDTSCGARRATTSFSGSAVLEDSTKSPLTR